MRIALALLVLAAGAVIVPASVTPAQADPYRWCAIYGGGQGGSSTNCYFMTLQQCQATVSGVGGFCGPNNFYDGRPVTTPGEAPSRRRAPH